ncbi:hypothetical protein TrLO_g6323 [Triparma laevis f. longispina]|uniref:MIR domain-containing protein n=1 Tax=Triparma laevis f. longispina TaxID=1714387 RepID=A0A9W7FTD6_9STRA|nr:hypothetical protein TrLO_g6323 [Triparma laevis f. longispina]
MQSDARTGPPGRLNLVQNTKNNIHVYSKSPSPTDRRESSLNQSRFTSSSADDSSNGNGLQAEDFNAVLDLTHTCAKYGDYIYLNGTVAAEADSDTNERVGFVHADGHYGNVGFMLENGSLELKNFRECLFQIIPMLNYESTNTRRELDMMSRRKSSNFNMEKVNEKEMVDIRMNQEKNQNLNILERCEKCEDDVLYGQLIQLRHVATGKYLQGNRFTSLLERDCLALDLHPGDELCHFRITPRFRVRQEGTQVYYEDQIQLISEHLDGYAIHTTNKKLTSSEVNNIEDQDTIFELNLSSTQSPLRICRFSRHDALHPHSLVSSTSLVRFLHPESNSFVSASCNAQKKMKSNRHAPYLRKVLAGSNPASVDNYSAKSIFVFEYKSRMSAGTVKWKDAIRVKHVATDKYLCVARKSTFLNGGKKKGHVVTMEDENDVSMESTLFHLVPTDIQGTTVPDSRVSMKIEHHIEGKDGEKPKVLEMSSIVKKQNKVLKEGEGQTAERLHIELNSNIVFVEEKQDHEALLCIPMSSVADSDFIYKLFNARSMIPFLNRFSKRLEKDGAREDCFTPTEVEEMENLLANLIKACGEFTGRLSAVENELTVDQALVFEDESSVMFQTLACDIKLTDAVFELANAPSLVKGSTGKVGMNMEYDNKKAAFSDDNFDNISTVVRLSWRALRQMFCENRRAENYYAKHKEWIEAGVGGKGGMIKQIPFPVGAAEAFDRLVSDNEELLEVEVGDSLIAALIKLIHERGPQERLINFFIAISTCQGKGVISNQESILTNVFMNAQNHKDMILKVYQKKDDDERESWYRPSQSEDKKSGEELKKDPNNLFLGSDLIEDGKVYPIWVSWEDMETCKSGNNKNNIDLDFRIEGKQSCSLVDFCKYASMSSSEIELEIYNVQDSSEANSLKSGRMGKRAEIHFQWALSLYFIGQIRLFAHICHGRSYNCINVLSRYFPYELCLQVVKDERLDFLVRTAFCTLMKNLWVDRYPHQKNCGRPKLPNLVWVYGEIERRDVDQDGSLLHFELPEGHPMLELDEANAEILSDFMDERGEPVKDSFERYQNRFLSMKNHTKFFLLRQFINRHLTKMDGSQIVGYRGRNAFTLALIEIASDLMSFGFFSTSSKIKELCSPLLNVLDGRADLSVELSDRYNRLLEFLPEEGKSNRTRMNSNLDDETTELDGEDGEERDNFAVNPLVKNDSGLQDKRLEMTIRRNMSSKNKLSKRNMRDSLLLDEDSLYLGDVDVKEMIEKKECLTEDYLKLMFRREMGEGRYDLNSDSLRVIQSKVKMLSVLSAVSSLSINHKLEDLLCSFKEFFETEGKPLLKKVKKGKKQDMESVITEEFCNKFFDLFDESGHYDGTKLDVDTFTDAPLDTICIDLIMYHSDELYEAALTFLTERWGQMQRLISFFPQVTLLASTTLSVFETFDRLELDFQQLRYYVRSYEVWGVHSMASPMDIKIFTHTKEILNKLVRFIYAKSDEIEEAETPKQKGSGKKLTTYITAIKPLFRNRAESAVTDDVIFNLKDKLPPSTVLKKKPNPLHQDILRNLGICDFILSYAIAIDYDIMKKVNSWNSAERTEAEIHQWESSLKRSQEWLYEVLRKFVYLTFAFVSKSPENQTVIFSKLDMFRARMGDKVVGEDLEEGLFVWDVIIELFQGNEKLCRWCPDALISSYAILLNESTDHLQRQRVLDFFMNLISPEAEVKSISRNQNLIMRILFDKSMKNGLTFEHSDDNLFYGKSIMTMALCSKDDNSLGAAKCQSIISLKEIESRLKSTCSVPNSLGGFTGNLQVCRALVEFAHHSYVSTPIRDIKLQWDQSIWSIISRATLRADKVLDSKVEAKDLVPRQMIESTLSLLSSYFNNHVLSEGWQRTGKNVKKVKEEARKLCSKVLVWDRTNDKSAVTVSPKSKTSARRVLRFIEVTDSRSSSKGVFTIQSSQSSIGTVSSVGSGASAISHFRPGHHGGDSDSEDEFFTENDAERILESKNRVSFDSRTGQDMMTIVANKLLNSSTVKSKILENDISFLNTLEDIENSTNPYEKSYVHLNTGQHDLSEDYKRSQGIIEEKVINGEDYEDEEDETDLLSNEEMSEKEKFVVDKVKGTKRQILHAIEKGLKNSESIAFTVFVLLLVLISTLLTLASSFDGHLEATLQPYELLISLFFFFEVSFRIGATATVYGDIDNFAFNSYNILDVIVVLLDFITLIDFGGEEHGANGWIKSLRGIRILRLLRVFRGFRRFRLLKREMIRMAQLKETQEANKYNARSNKITFDMLCRRLITYVGHNVGSENRFVKKETAIFKTLEILTKHLVKYRTSSQALKDDRSSRVRTKKGWKEETVRRADSLKSCQCRLTESGACQMIIQSVSETQSTIVLEYTLRFSCELLFNCNQVVQVKFLECFWEEDKVDGVFFSKMRNLIRDAAKSLRSYRTTKSVVTRTKSFVVPITVGRLSMDFMRLLCEGHNSACQKILRQQDGNVQSFNIIMEVCGLLSECGRSLTVVRSFDIVQSELCLSALKFLIEACHGPCAENQMLIINHLRALGACKNILSCDFGPKLEKEEVVKAQLYASATTLLSALLESRGENSTGHSVLCEQIPTRMLEQRMIVISEAKESLKKKIKKREKQRSSLKRKNWKFIKSKLLETAGMKAERLDAKKEEIDLKRELDSELRANLMLKREITFGNKDSENVFESDSHSGDMLSRSMIKSVEVYWNGRCEHCFFTLPDEWRSLNKVTKESFLQKCDLSTSETRVRSLVENVDMLKDSMKYQYRLSKRTLYRRMRELYFPLKKIIYILVILLNLNILFSTKNAINENLDGRNLTAAAMEQEFYINYVVPEIKLKSNDEGKSMSELLSMTIFSGYCAIIVFVMISFSRLVWTESYRSWKRSLDKGMRSGKQRHNYAPIVNFLGVVAFTIAYCYIHALTSTEMTTADYAKFFPYFLLFLPTVIRRFFIVPRSRLASYYCALYDVIMHAQLRNHILLAIIIFIGRTNPMLSSLALFDVMTMSRTLQSVLRAVIKPANQLGQTFFLFVVVITVYTCIAYRIFGKEEFSSLEVDEDLGGCTTLWECWWLSMYIGIRKGDMGEALDVNTVSTSQWRVLYDLTFYMILGVLLFNMVTGIILDTFQQLRHDMEERNDIWENENFISGIKRAQYEELGPEYNFKTLCDHDQHLWNYFFFIVYVRQKKSEACNGCESYVKQCLEKNDSSWIPTRTSSQMESKQVGQNNQRSADDWFKEIVGKMEKLEAKVEDLSAAQAADGVGGH